MHTARSTAKARRPSRAWPFLAVALAFLVVLASPRAGAQTGAAAAATPSASTTPSASAAPAASSTAPAASSAAPASSDEAPTEAAAPLIPKTPAEEADGLPIHEITVVGNTRVATERILDYLRLKPGITFSATTLSRDVRELWGSGLFASIEVELDRRDDGSVDLRFRVAERPNVKLVVFEGNKAIESDKLREEIEIKENTVLSEPAVRRSVQKLKDKYAEKGYFLAEITSEIVPEKDNEATVKFVIKEGLEVSIKKITFVGNYHVSDDELKSVMLSAQGGFLGLGSGATYRKDVFERDVLILQALYSDKGYLAIQVQTPRVMLTPDRDGIEVTIVIEEGPQFTVKKFDIYELDADGKPVEPLGGRKKVRSLVNVNPGDVFNRAALVKDLTAVKTLYHDAGYAAVEADPQTHLDFEKREVEISVPIKRGPKVRIGRIEVKGNSKTSDRVIRREMTVVEGQLYSETGLEESRRRVLALGFFERVDVTTEKGASPDTIDVFFEVGERPTGTFQVGAGFSSIESFIATAQVQQANLFGRGQSLSLQAQVSGLRQLIDLRFFEPYLFESDWSASIDLYDRLMLYDAFSQTSIGGAMTLGYPIIMPWLRASLTYTAEHVTIDTSQASTFFGVAAPSIIFFQRLPLANVFQSGFLSSLRATLLYDTRNDRLFPTNGVFIQASSELASHYFESSNEFLRHRLTARFYYNLGDNWVIKLNTEWGYVTSPSTAGVPIFARFFLGGIFDVRGFLLRSIGPRLPLYNATDPNSAPIPYGANIGGNMQAYGNLELEFPIIDKVGIRGVIFLDAGNTWNTEQLYCSASRGAPIDPVIDPCSQNLLSLRTSYGVGVRWFSPLGPLRFEWGFPFKPLPYEQHSDFEFTIGNFF